MTANGLAMPRVLRGMSAGAALAALLCLVSVSGVTAQPAGGPSKIVYVCAPNLCAVDPVSGVSSRLTTDGTAELPYGDPSLSADGRRIAASRGDDVLVGVYGRNLTERWNGSQGLNDVALSPNGAAVAESHSYVRNVNRVQCVPFGGCSLALVLEDFSGASYSAGAAAEGAATGVPGGAGVGFLGNGSLLTSYYTLDTDTHTVCVVASPGAPADPPCSVRAEEVGASLSWPDGSPDSRLIAAAKGPAADGGDTVVNVYDAASGAFVRQVATGTVPAFSPDGSQIAYQSPSGSIEIVPTGGGAPRSVATGAMPTWGAGAGPGPAVAARRLRYADRRVKVAIRCTGRARCAGTVRIEKRRATIGTRRYRVAAGRKSTVMVRPTPRGRATIAKARRHTVTVQLRPAGGGPITTKLVLRR